jgi:membrane AbrB-like protein
MRAEDLAPVLATLTAAAAAGFAADALGLPLPFLLGALGATAALTLAGVTVRGAPLRMPRGSRDLFVPVIGVAIGATVTPEIVGQAARWWPSLLAVAPYVVGVQLLTFALYRRLGGYDRPTAFFSAAPGGLVDAVLMGERRGGRVAALSSQHFLRIALTVAVVPLLLSGFAPADGIAATAPEVVTPWPSAAGAATLLVCAAAGAWLGTRPRLPAAVMLGPFLLSALVHVAGLTRAEVPEGLVHLAQIVVGATLGLRFEGVRGRQIAQAAGLAALGVALALGIAGALALALAPLIDARPAAIFLAFAPGGVAEMGLVAVSLGVEPAFVIAHHLLRIVLTVTVAPLLYDQIVGRRPAGRRAAARRGDNPLLPSSRRWQSAPGPHGRADRARPGEGPDR